MRRAEIFMVKQYEIRDELRFGEMRIADEEERGHEQKEILIPCTEPSLLLHQLQTNNTYSSTYFPSSSFHHIFPVFVKSLPG